MAVAEGEAILRDVYYEAGASHEPTDWSVGGAELRRLPIVRPGGLEAGTGVPTKQGWHVRGLRMYELKDHLGNVHVVVSDRHLIIDADNDCLAEGFTADVLMSTDYYPYGSEMPGRVYNSPLCRYGFHGKEKEALRVPGAVRCQKAVRGTCMTTGSGCMTRGWVGF